jgi:hypothetical protein
MVGASAWGCQWASSNTESIDAPCQSRCAGNRSKKDQYRDRRKPEDTLAHRTPLWQATTSDATARADRYLIWERCPHCQSLTQSATASLYASQNRRRIESRLTVFGLTSNCHKAHSLSATFRGGCKTCMTPPSIFGVAEISGIGSRSTTST